MPVLVFASSGIEASVNGVYYETFEEALANAGSNDTIKLFSNVFLENSVNIDKTVNINLNGKDISAKTAVFMVQGGALNLEGTGTIKETEPNYGAIRVIGSTNINDDNYSVLNVGENVTLEGWAGVFITHESSKSYGVEVNIKGKINAVSDTSGGTGIGVYVNGTIQHLTNVPIVNIEDGAVITSNGNGLYIAGYAVFNIGKAKITGVESGIGIKSGILNIDGASVLCTGSNETPTEGFNNGIKASGTTLQIESNNGYAGDMEINISNGNFTSKNSYVVYEYIGKGSATEVKSISISNGTFVSEAGKNVFEFSNAFNNTHKRFISGGEYSSDPSSYLKTGYSSSKEGNLYNVSASTLKGVFGESNNQSGGFAKTIVLIIASIAILGLLYFYRNKILSTIKRYI